MHCVAGSTTSSGGFSQRILHHASALSPHSSSGPARDACHGRLLGVPPSQCCAVQAGTPLQYQVSPTPMYPAWTSQLILQPIRMDKSDL